MSYKLRFERSNIDAVEFALGRYSWADTLWDILTGDHLEQPRDSTITVELAEHEAWELVESLTADDGWCPCLDPTSSLAESLLNLEEEIV